jgi:hypothetical protein
VFFENLGDDAGHIEVLEDALVEAVRRYASCGRRVTE